MSKRMDSRLFLSLGGIFVLMLVGLAWSCSPTPGKEGSTEKSTDGGMEKQVGEQPSAESGPEAKEQAPESTPEATPEREPEASGETPLPDEANPPEPRPEPAPEPHPEPPPETAPEATTEAQPEATPESTPEGSPESRPELPPGKCRNAYDCPKQPPPINCVGAHWECVQGTCKPTCGDPKTCDSLKRYIDEEKERIAHCSNDAVCKIKPLGHCPFGCYLAYQWLQNDKRLNELIALYNKNKQCPVCTYRCASPAMMNVHCQHKKRCVVVTDTVCNKIKTPKDCLKNGACRAVFGPSCPQCSDFGYQGCVPIEKKGCTSKQVKARSGSSGTCQTFPSECNVPHGWKLCP